jgi:carboxymethylenebutenolidase
LAVDLASHEGGTERFSDPAQVTAVLGRTPVDTLVAMLLSAVAYLRTQPLVRADRLGAVGWCFGGGMVWRLVTRSPELRAAVAFYGPNPPLEDVPRIRAAVLGIYGELDHWINQGIPARCLVGENPLGKTDRGPQKSRSDFWGGLDWLRRYLEG